MDEINDLIEVLIAFAIMYMGQTVKICGEA